VGQLRVITSGLKAGERVVVDGLQRVRPGAPVAPQMVPMEGEAAASGAAK
jgi:multidrug efflux system membrane fusion protein